MCLLTCVVELKTALGMTLLFPLVVDNHGASVRICIAWSLSILFSTSSSCYREVGILPALTTPAALTVNCSQHWKFSVDSPFVNAKSSRFRFPNFILLLNECFAFSSSLFSSTSLDDERCRNGARERDDELPDAMWLHQIQPSSRQELICLNLSLCSAATIWMPGREELASSAVISAAWEAAGSLFCPDIWAEKRWALRQDGRVRGWRGKGR